MYKNRQERHETVDINVASASTARRTRRRQPRASAAHMLGARCGVILLYKSAFAPSEPSYHPFFPPSRFYHVQQRLLRPTTAAILSSCGCGFSHIILISATSSMMGVCSQVRHPVRGVTTLNNLNRPTRVATVVSLAINHTHRLNRSTCRF